MGYTIEIHEWLKDKLEKELVELPNLAIEQQIDNYNKAESGVGFLLLLAMTSSVDEDDYPDHTAFSLISVPIVKLLGRWVTILDENLADFLSAVVRLVAPDRGDITEDDRITSEP